MDIEAEMELYEETIDGVHFWDWVRQKAVYQSPTVVQHNRNMLHRGTALVQDAALLLRNTFLKNPLRAGEVDILFHGGQRSRTAGNTATDRYCDPVIDQLDSRGWTYLLLEQPFNHQHIPPPEIRNIRYLEFIDYTASLLVNLRLSRVKLSQDEKAVLHEVERRLQEDADHTIDMTGLVRRTLEKRQAALPLYRALLRRTNPDVAVIGHSSGGYETFMEACQQMDIPVVELQHGVLSPYHLATSFPGERTKRAFPDYFFVWGTFWKDNASFPIPDDHIYSVGFPFHERERERYDDVTPHEQVVFISQETIGEPLSRFAASLDSHLQDTRIVYKLHPDEDIWDMGTYPWLEESDIDIISDEKPLYELFSESSAQVGVYSTALFEGHSFDLDTYLVSIPGIEHVPEFAASPATTVVETPDELASHLSRSGGGTATDVEQFFKPDAAQNTVDALEEIIQAHGR